MEFQDDAVIIEKKPSELDELVFNVTDVLDDLGIRYAVVSGYVAVLLGRSRATEDIDVITESFSEETANVLAGRLADAGYWGSAMPLDSMYQMLSERSIIRIAEDGHRTPNVELKFADDRYDRASLEKTFTIRLNEHEVRAGELELQIAYKLRLGTQKDLEDAVYIYELAGQSLNSQKIKKYAKDLGVEQKYEQLTQS